MSSKKIEGRLSADDETKQQPFHPAIMHVLKYFSYGHLPEKIQEVSKPFGELALEVAKRSPNSQETTVALRKLLEAKDAAVRASLDV